MRSTALTGMMLFVICSGAHAQAAGPFDAAAAFGARPSVQGLTLSPDGKTIAYLTPIAGQGSIVHALSLEPGSKPRMVMSANGNPDRIGGCSWVSNDRLVCRVCIVMRDPAILMLEYVARQLAVDVTATNPKVLSKPTNSHTYGVDYGGGGIIDTLPEENGVVLMARSTLPDDHLGSRVTTSDFGFGVDRVDTRTLAYSQIEKPNRKAEEYITDGRGNVRIMLLRDTQEGSYELPTVT